MRKFALLLLALAQPALAGDFISDLDANLGKFTQAYASYLRSPTAENQGRAATVEMVVTNQVFSTIDELKCEYKDEKLYRASFESVNRLSNAWPAAVADLGMKLENRWEHDCLLTFYRNEKRSRMVFEASTESVLVVGGLLMGARHVADPAVVERYFGAIRNLWLGVASVPTVGTTIDYKIQNAPPPPATLVALAMGGQLDYRAREFANAQHRRFMAKALGLIASSEIIGVGVKVAAERPTPVAAAVILGVMAGSWYVGQSVEELADWNFAWADEFGLETAAWESFFEMGQSYTPRTKSSLPDFIVPKWKRITKYEALRQLSDSVLRLVAHRDLKILLAEMNLADELAEIERKYGPSEDNPQKRKFNVSVRHILESRGGPFLDPMTIKWLVRQNLRKLGLSPYVPSERAELTAIIAGWVPTLRNAANHWLSGSDASLSPEDGERLFSRQLDQEEAADQAALARAGYEPYRYPLSPHSDGLFLQTAAYLRSFHDPSIDYVAELMESRAEFHAGLLLDVMEGQ